MSWVIQWVMASQKISWNTQITIYTYTSTNNNTWLNFNEANDNSAWSFTRTNAGIPTSLVLRMRSITWTPTGNFYIKWDKTIGSTTYRTATWVTITSLVSTIRLTWWSMLTAWNTYWVYFERTSNSSNYFRIYNEYTNPPAQQFWHSSASNIDPDVRYDSVTKNIWMSMDLIWVI
jgi:hypothetical protein